MDVTNLDTQIIKDEEINTFGQNEVLKSTKVMFEIIEGTLKENPSIQHIVLLDRTPRFDPKEVDPAGIKPKLAEYGNALNEKFRDKSAYKDKIFIGKHTFDCNQETFGPSDIKHFDGIHMIGKKGSENYTKILIDVLSHVQKSSPQTVNFHPSGRTRTQILQLPTGNSEQITPPSATTTSRPPLNTTRT